MIDQLYLKQFNKIYDKTYNRVLKYVVCRCSDMEDVNDIIQETYMDVYKAIIKNKEIDDIDKYVIGITKNKIRKHYSLLYKIKTISILKNNLDDKYLLDVVKSDIDIEKIVIKNIDIEVIWNYLKSKKMIIQRIFYLYYGLDMKIKDIAKELEVSESYTKNYLYRTLRELQELFGKDCD